MKRSSPVTWREFDARVRLGGEPTIAAKFYWRQTAREGDVLAQSFPGVLTSGKPRANATMHAFYILASDALKQLGNLNWAICDKRIFKRNTRSISQVVESLSSWGNPKPCVRCLRKLEKFGALR